ncbi:MAG: glycine cleavage system protein H [Candidatus Heimdallarchaeum endolithica]|uniref:Glycine cleavage system protein H n=1 Tax=Candidatus Heimdallarchaeum endolithica TaxID=2876572 RepID=A0A9Y1FPH5_9ARCH|nr:MAG: glycine cleavage system protein H [Candidatus Heimdallarchaeum endolithica]
MKRQFKFPEVLLYQSTYVWIKDIGRGVYAIGITDYAQYLLDDIVTISLPVDDYVEQGDELISIESIYETIEIESPFTGKIIEINDDVKDNPELLNEDAFSSWILKIEITDDEELDDLYTADEVFDLFQEELEEQGDEELTKEFGAFVQFNDDNEDGWV